MRVVHHAEAQSMSWCLDCHKQPEKHLRPLDEVFNLKWQPEDLSRKDFTDYLAGKADAATVAELLPLPKNGKPDEALSQEEIGSALKELWNIHPPSPNNCSGCHR
jgi:hypothetical protein